MINNILFITLSNIGDCILTLPVLDILMANFPKSKITVMVGPRSKEIFLDNPKINELIIFDKLSRLTEKRKLFNKLKRNNFDMVLDLRNSFQGAILPAKYKISPFLFMPKNLQHMKERHLYKIASLKSPACRIGGEAASKIQGNSLHIRHEDEEYIKKILEENGVTELDKIIVVAPGARSHIKRWPQDKFTQLIPSLVKEFGVKVLLVGDKEDAAICKYITQATGSSAIDLSGKTNLMQLASLLKKCRLLISNDSAILHLASYVNIPIVAIFGPTSEIKYGPWSEIFRVVKKDIFCRPCEKAQCRFGTLKCMQLVRPEDVLRQARALLVTNHLPAGQAGKPQVISKIPDFKRILIVRTDRIGDVLLSTPVIKVLRDNYPYAYIAMMVSPYGKSIIEDNPYLDEVIVYDKDSKHKSWARSLKFAQNLKKKKFDATIILHPTNRVHLLAFYSGIRRRIGYDRKHGFLLTDKIRHTKQLGEKHESEYALDLVRHLGIRVQDKDIFLALKPESETWAEELLDKQGIKKTDKLLAIHPGASCPSKIWPNERFAEVADRLIKKYGFKVLVIGGPKDTALGQAVIKHMHQPAIDISGRTSVSQLASILKKCSLFISNDSGPVHIASCVGIPVISIFGRSQKGLGPLRWGPTGKKSKVVHKNVGCIECLAHNCVKEFACLKAITVDDIIDAADSLLDK
jgi:heptosyltransferase-2